MLPYSKPEVILPRKTADSASSEKPKKSKEDEGYEKAKAAWDMKRSISAGIGMNLRFVACCAELAHINHHRHDAGGQGYCQHDQVGAGGHGPRSEPGGAFNRDGHGQERESVPWDWMQWVKVACAFGNLGTRI